MSTGSDCAFIEVNPGQWSYNLQIWPYGDNDDYNTYGPFSSFTKAEDHLAQNHANPGGWSIKIHPTNHKHEFRTGQVGFEVGVHVEIRVESLGPKPEREAVLALLQSGSITTSHLTMRPVYSYREGLMCTSCNQPK